MKNVQIRSLLIFFASLSYFMNACSSNLTNDNMPTSSLEVIDNTLTYPTSSPTIFITSTPIPTPQTLFPTISPTPAITETSTPAILSATPRPTLDYFAGIKVIEEFVIDNGGCDLPCLWGIIPGKTTFNQGIEKLDYLGWKGDLYKGLTYEGFWSIQDSTNFIVSLSQEEGLVSHIHFYFSHQMFTILDQYYSMNRILKRFGVPSQIWINIATRIEVPTYYPGYDIYIFYEDRGLLAKYPGFATLGGNQFQLCPTHPDAVRNNPASTAGRIVLYLADPLKKQKPEDIVLPFDQFGEKLTINQALGISPEKFYQQIVNPTNGQTCFYSDRNIWP